MYYTYIFTFNRENTDVKQSISNKGVIYVRLIEGSAPFAGMRRMIEFFTAKRSNQIPKEEEKNKKERKEKIELLDMQATA